MKRTIIAALLVCSAGFTFAQTWSIDKAHSKVGFEITHMMISDVEGSFGSFDATVTSSKDDFSDAKVELTADISSIDTDNEQRDKHLQSPDYFDAAKYPKLTFKSKSIKKKGDKTYALTGDLTMHGVTKSVTLEVKYRGTVTNPMSKKPVAGFKVTGTIKRTDFGIAPDTAEAMLSDEVAIEVSAEFVKN